MPRGHEQWLQRASQHQRALRMALKGERERQVLPPNFHLNILQIVTSCSTGTTETQTQVGVKKITEHIQAVGEPKAAEKRTIRRLVVPQAARPACVAAISQPVKPGKFLIHSNLKLVTSQQRRETTETTTTHAKAVMSSVVKTPTTTTIANQITPQRQVYLTGIPILTAERRPGGDTVANILVKSLPRGVHALQVRNTDATYLIPVSCPDVSIPVTIVPRTPTVQVTPKPRPEADPALQEQLLEFDKVCKEVKERSAPVRTPKKATKEAATRHNDEEHKHAKIYAILAEYHKKLANSPDLNNKPAPRRRSAPSSGGAVVAKRKKVAVAVQSTAERAAKRPPKEPESSNGALVNYVSIVRPLRIALGGQRLVALSSANLPTAASTTVQNQCNSRAKVLVLDKPSGQYLLKQLSVSPATNGGAPKVPENDSFRQSIAADCEDLGVDVPNASDLFPEADYLLDEASEFGAEEVIEAPPGDTVIRTQ
ncbi:uncharacterized protein LOC129793887 [Lutzomyia longipalpis]|uniref:uncharacterized protein LOC129793887 n=1 Tax=Lutzomyia longipalpis TaxID=7200 RepID=UPI002483433D|nr:uncharacterized protein LOC129793887 [Lutzomyia longipalpis]